MASFLCSQIFKESDIIHVLRAQDNDDTHLKIKLVVIKQPINASDATTVNTIADAENLFIQKALALGSTVTTKATVESNIVTVATHMLLDTKLAMGNTVIINPLDASSLSTLPSSFTQYQNSTVPQGSFIVLLKHNEVCGPGYYAEVSSGSYFYALATDSSYIGTFADYVKVLKI